MRAQAGELWVEHAGISKEQGYANYTRRARSCSRKPDAKSPGPVRALLESIAVEGCRSETLSVGQAAELLGTSHNEVDGLLKDAGVYLNYRLEDLDTDRGFVPSPGKASA
jgi:hypothetical protein